MNQVSPAAMQAMMAQTTNEVFLSFMRVEHPSLSAPILLVCNYEPIVRHDGTYQPFAFNAPSPAQVEDGKVPQTQITIDNTDLSVQQAMRTLRSPPTVTLFTALASSPDVVEEGPYVFQLAGVDCDENQITGTLSYDASVFDQNMPAQIYSPVNSPGLFA